MKKGDIVASNEVLQILSAAVGFAGVNGGKFVTCEDILIAALRLGNGVGEKCCRENGILVEMLEQQISNGTPFDWAVIANIHPITLAVAVYGLFPLWHYRRRNWWRRAAWKRDQMVINTF